MPWNGSGTFNRTTGVSTGAAVWADAKAAGRTVRTDDHDTHDEDLATGMENTVARDGQNSASANLPMATFRHTGVGNAVARTEYAAAGQVQDGSFAFVSPSGVAGTGDAVTLSPSPAITAYAAGQQFSFVVEGTNTGAVTVDVSSLGTKAVQKLAVALVAGDLTIGDLIAVEYDGTQFQLLTPTRTAILAAGSIATAALADNAVTLDKMAGGTAGNLITYDASADPAVVATGTAGQSLTSNGVGAAPTMQDHPLSITKSPPEMSNNATDPTDSIDIAVGKCRDTADTANLAVATAIGKDISATWAAGGTTATPTGGMSSSLHPVQNDTTYHAFLGKVSDTEEVGFDSSATGANLVTDHSFTNTRRLGSVRRGTATNIAFSQTADNFLLDVPVRSDNSVDPGTSARTITLSVPVGVIIDARIACTITASGDQDETALLVTPLKITDTAPSAAAHDLVTATHAQSGVWRNSVFKAVETNASAQIRTRVDKSDAATVQDVITHGWIDRRGRDG